MVRVIPTAARLLASSVFFRAWVLEGHVRGSSSRVKLLYGGFAEHLAYVKRLVFDGDPQSTALGRVTTWTTGLLAKNHDPDLVMVPAHRLMKKASDSPLRFFLPWWVTGEVRTDIDYTRPPWKARLRDDMRRIRKAGFTYDVSRDPTFLEEYYRTMYLPVVRNAHEDSALPVPLDQLRELLRGGGELFLVLRGSQPVAGEFVFYTGRRVCVRTIGVKNADPGLIKEGAVAACYYNTIQQVRSKGYDRLDFGGCRPFLHDGLLAYKKKWGLQLTGHDKCGHYFWVRRLSDGTQAFLVANPFIHVKEKQLWGAVFAVDSTESTHPSNHSESLLIGGMAGIEKYLIAGDTIRLSKTVGAGWGSTSSAEVDEAALPQPES
jgi:hypothetical protein